MKSISIQVLCLIITLFSPISYSETERDMPLFDIHFVVMTQRHGIENQTSVQQLRNEVDILNQYFVGANGVKPVKFRYKSQRSIKELNHSPCREFLLLGDVAAKFDWDKWTDGFNACSDSRVVDPHAINFYIYDAYSNKKGFDEIDSHARNNQGRPFIALDWERLNHQLQSPEEHEMGHAFGLAHVCVEGATLDSSTNIMASHRDCEKGSGGRRNIGFDEAQLNTIRQKARSIAKRLNSL